MMTAALEQAQASLAAGGVPVGAVLAAGQEIITPPQRAVSTATRSRTARSPACATPGGRSPTRP